MVEKNEQVQYLVDIYLDSESSSDVLHDMEQGMSCLQDHPVLPPSPETIQAIKHQICIRLKRKTRAIPSRLAWIPAIAAVFLVGTLLFLSYWPKESIEFAGGTIENPPVWTIDSDPFLSDLKNDLEEVLDETLRVSPDRYYLDSPGPIEQIEKELQMMASTEDFWKG